MDWQKLARVTAKLELRWWKLASAIDANGEINATEEQRSEEMRRWDRMRRCRVRAAIAANEAGALAEGSKLYRSELVRIGCYARTPKDEQ